MMMSPDRARAADASQQDTDRGSLSIAAALEGFRFVLRAPLIRSTMVLDFFATLFSSATALLLHRVHF